jgi:hypothetical protein
MLIARYGLFPKEIKLLLGCCVFRQAQSLRVSTGKILSANG